MRRFDFLHDAPAELVEILLGMRLPRRFHTVASAFAMMICVVAAAKMIEVARYAQVETVEQRAQTRFERSRTALVDANLRWQELDALLDRDRRLREIRLSSSIVAARLVKIGNNFPARAWLTTLSWSQLKHGLQGRAESLTAVNAMLAALLRSGVDRPHSIRISRDDSGQSRFFTFSVELGG